MEEEATRKRRCSERGARRIRGMDDRERVEERGTSGCWSERDTGAEETEEEAAAVDSALLAHRV